MLQINKNYIICFLISSCLIFLACIPSTKSVKGTLASRSIFETGISSEGVKAEIGRLKAITENKTGEVVSVDTNLRLAILYSSYKNKEPDYVSALTALEKYMAVYNVGGDNSEVKTLHTLLLRIQHLSVNKSDKKLRSYNRALTKQNNVLTKRNKELITNNEALKETIKKLGSIDLKLEQKRKSYK